MNHSIPKNVYKNKKKKKKKLSNLYFQFRFLE